MRDEWLANRSTSEFGIVKNKAREFGREHRLWAALVRHCVLTGSCCLAVSVEGAPRLFWPQSTLNAFRPVLGLSPRAGLGRVPFQLVRSLAHRPDQRQCLRRDFTSLSHNAPGGNGSRPGRPASRIGGWGAWFGAGLLQSQSGL